MRVTLPRDKSVTEYNLGVALRDARSFDYLDVTRSKDLTRRCIPDSVWLSAGLLLPIQN